MIDSVSVRLLPAVATAVPLQATEHWLLLTLPLAAMLWPGHNAVPASFNRCMTLPERECAR